MSGMMQMLLVSGGETVTLSNQSINDFSISPTDSTAGYRLESDGDILQLNPGASDIGDWIVPKSAAPGIFEVRATLNSGSLAAGSDATGSFLALTSNRLWQCQITGLGTQTANLTIEIRKGTGPVLASCTVDLDATVEP